MTDGGTSVKGIAAARATFGWLLLALLVVASLGAGIDHTGMWEPGEVEMAEFSRRIAVSLLGGEELRLAGMSNSVPTQAELQRGQLPFTSVALGFRVFGLHPWAGRVPLLAWGLLGVLATFILAARFAGREVAALSAMVLSTMPLYFVQARTMLGEIVILAVFAAAVACLAFAAFGCPWSLRERVWLRGVWFLAGLGFSLLGVLCRGLVIGAALPMLSVGVTFWLLPPGLRLRRRVDTVVASLLTAAGLLTLGVGILALSASVDSGQTTLWSGVAVQKLAALPPFDSLVQQLGHGLLPWSVFLPAAVWALTRQELPEAVGNTPAVADATVLAVLIQVSLALSFAVVTLLSAWVDALAFPAVFALALAAALALGQLNASRQGSRMVSVLTLALMLILVFDLKTFPEKAFTPFLVRNVPFPEGFQAGGWGWLSYGLLGLTAVFALIYSHRDTAGHEGGRRRYENWRRCFGALAGGNVQFAAVVLALGAVALRLGKLLSDTSFHFTYFERLGSVQRSIVDWMWLAVPLFVWGLPLLLISLTEVGALLVNPTRGWRWLPAPGWLCGGALSVGGVVMSGGYFPALLRELTPMTALDAYRSLARADEPVGILGSGARVLAHYSSGGEVPTFDRSEDAFAWLFASPKERRWLVLPSASLPDLDSSYRRMMKPPQSLPVLDATSNEALLVSSQLGGLINQNPFAPWFATVPPRPHRAMDANLGGALDVLGWEVRANDGKPRDSIKIGEACELRIFYKVVGTVAEEWRTFVHIDGKRGRFNGDHDTLGGRYPMLLWNIGDYVTDSHPFTVDRSFAAGRYRLYFGLYSGNRRLEVVTGAAESDRLDAGEIELR